jgi:hypothetical protein
VITKYVKIFCGLLSFLELNISGIYNVYGHRELKEERKESKERFKKGPEKGRDNQQKYVKT